MIKFIVENIYYYILLTSILLSFGLHFNTLNKEFIGKHNWRQAQTMWNIRNFYRHDSNILNPRVSHFNGDNDNLYRYEFPIMQWSIAMLQKLFGEKIAVVRISVFIIGMLSVLLFFLLLQVLGLGKLPSLAGAIFFQFSPVFYYYTINPIPDNLALLGSIIYLYYIFSYFKKNRLKYLIGSSLGLLLATFAKLPFLMFGIISLVYFIKKTVKRKRITKDLWMFTIIQSVFLLPAFIWHKWVMPSWVGNGILKGIFDNQISWETTFTILNYHIGTMFPLVLLSPIVWVFIILGFIYLKKEYNNHPDIRKYIYSMIFITFLYLTLQFNMINTLHDYYMMPFFPWLYIIVAFGIKKIIDWKLKFSKYIVIVALVLSPIVAVISNVDNWSLKHTYINPDIVLYQDQLKKAVPQDELCIILNDNSYFIFSYMIDKMGHVFSGDYLPIGWIDDMVNNYGIKYMYSDSKKLNESPEFKPYIDSLLMEAGSVKVFKLKPKDK